MRCGCIGEHLSHSFSREIHSLLSDDGYELTELRPEELLRFFTEKDFLGINVTVPYKQCVIPYLDRISDRAKRIGAVNTVVNRDGVLFGDNTDYVGMKLLAEKSGLSFSGKKVLILGTGGTSKTAFAVAEDGCAKEIVFVSRRKTDGAVGYDDAPLLHGDADIIINTTPCGMYPEINEVPIDLSLFPRLSGVIDAVYNPIRTGLVLDAKARGINAAGGLFMLAAQAVAASELFHGKKYPDGTAERVYEKITAKKENLVLIGMPSCGKTTVGEILSRELDRPLIDLDRMITEKYGKTPAEIIRTHGTEHFRALETKMTASGSTQSGCVIAAGGGTVLRGENVRNLKKNGKLVFLDRPVELLIPTADRPLSSTKERLETLFRERYPVYQGAADLRISAVGSPEEIAAIIRKECYV